MSVLSFELFILQADKHVPMHLRRKMRNEKQKARHFEIMPPTGVLMPGQRLNVQVKFMPTEEVSTCKKNTGAMTFDLSVTLVFLWYI